LLKEIPQSRLFDEMLKLLQTGHALASVEQLRKLGLAKGIYPLLDVVVERAELPLVHAVLQDTDRRVGEGKAVAPSFLLSCVLWPDVRAGWEQRQAAGEHAFPALQAAIDDVFARRIGDVSGRGKLAADMREIWVMQPRFERRTGHGAHSMVAHIRFRAGFDFLRLRADSGEVPDDLVNWWQQFSIADEARREDMLDQLREEQRKRTRQRKASPEAAQAAAPDPDAAESVHAAPARKRRRRRRKPTGGEGAGTDAQ